jgi:hypothetical protein
MYDLLSFKVFFIPCYCLLMSFNVFFICLTLTLIGMFSCNVSKIDTEEVGLYPNNGHNYTD